MRKFLLFILAEVEQHPDATIEQIAHNLSLPAKAVRECLKELYQESIVLPRSGGLYVTFLGRIALNKYNVEKAQKMLSIRQEALRIVCTTLQISPSEIEHFSPTELGMTNRSFLMSAKNKKYIFRMPGEGTDQLVDRYREYSNYLALEGKGLSDVVIYHNPTTGIKMTEYLNDCRSPNKKDAKDLAVCMGAVRKIHKSGISVNHLFNFAERIDYYEQLCTQENVLFFPGYQRLHFSMQRLLSLLDKIEKPLCFCHIDSVPGNFLIAENGAATLIDWEYAGMCDPLADVAMFCLSARFTKPECDRLLKIYLQTAPTKTECTRFYCYLALGGFMWSLWAEYKASLGENYTEYGAKMVEYAQQYSKIVLDRTSGL